MISQKVKIYTNHLLELTHFLRNYCFGMVQIQGVKGPVKLIKRVKIAHSFLQSAPM